MKYKAAVKLFPGVDEAALRHCWSVSHIFRENPTTELFNKLNDERLKIEAQKCAKEEAARIEQSESRRQWREMKKRLKMTRELAKKYNVSSQDILRAAKDAKIKPSYVGGGIRYTYYYWNIQAENQLKLFLPGYELEKLMSEQHFDEQPSLQDKGG